MSNKTEDKTMKPEEKRTLAPKLRFPEFRDDWAVEKLGEIGKLSGGGTPDKSVAEYWQGDIPWVSSSDIYEDDIYTISITRFINEKSISESATKIVPKGSVLFVSRVGTGKLAVNDIVVCTSQDFMNLIPKKVINYFLGYFFIANKSALVSLGQGTSIKGFSKGDLEKFEVSYPCDLEQQKIADCLASLDKRITLEAQKLDTLKTHKKGLMQQLFPAEGETLPKLRFPEFRDAGEWESIPLGQLAERCTQKNGQGKLNRVLTNSAEFGVVNQRDYFDKDIANQSNLEGYFVVEKGDYVYNPRISTTAPVGPISRNNLEAGVMSPLYTVFRFYNSRNDFYAYYFKTSGWHQYMRQASSTGARHDRMAIINSDFMAMPLPVAYPEEQQKIADCLSSLDDLITAQSQKIAALKTHKKGLMQQLFPSADEVTG